MVYTECSIKTDKTNQLCMAGRTFKLPKSINTNHNKDFIHTQNLLQNRTKLIGWKLVHDKSDKSYARTPCKK